MIWKDVKGYEGLYKVNQHGDVMSNARRGNRYGTHIMKPQDDGHGYRQLCLSKNGKQKSVRIHRLVAEAFVPNPNGYTEVNHIDEDRWNCDASNLEWCSRKYNVSYGTRTAKTSSKVGMYSQDMELINVYGSIREACRANNFNTPGNISNVLKGKAATAYGYVWKEVC